MKILMLVNWKVEYCTSAPSGKQPPDYFVKGEPYWFFRYFEKQDDLDIDVVDISSFKAMENFEKNRLRFYVLQSLKVWPKIGTYDLVISHGMQSGIVLCLLRSLFKKKSYKHIAFDIGAFNSARTEGRALKLMKKVSKSLDWVIYHTKSQLEYYEKCHPWLVPKSDYVTFGTDVEYFTAGDNEETKDYILCAGYHQRDWDTLLKAYKLSNQKLKLYLLGNTDIKLEEGLENVKLIGGVNVEKFKELIRGAAFCVLPLENLNFSFGQMTLLQQMAMGKAVIVSDVPSVRAYLKDGANIKYESGSATELCEKLNDMMDNPQMAKDIGKQASNLVRSRFDEKTMALEIEKIIRKVGDKNGS